MERVDPLFFPTFLILNGKIDLPSSFYRAFFLLICFIDQSAWKNGKIGSVFYTERIRGEAHSVKTEITIMIRNCEKGV